MRIAYLDCQSGIAGDMTLAALVDVGIPLGRIQSAIDSLGLPSCRLEASTVKKHGFRATKIDVVHEPEHAHRHLSHITEMIDGSTLTDRQKDLAKRIFTRLGEAEARVHGTTIEKVHFHEVGAVDSIADVVGAAVAWDLLEVDRITASPIPTGCGEIEIAHGRVSVPAPATAELLRGIPTAPCDIRHELTTPTGAAIIATLVEEFGPPPPMTIEQLGYGAGTRDLEEQANIVRLYVGQATSQPQSQTTEGINTDKVLLLETNLDDVPGEVVGYAIERLWQAGALDVYTAAITMKKNRPGVILSVMAPADRGSELERILFEETGTLGIRRIPVERRVLERESVTVETSWGQVRGKVARLGDRAYFSPEFDDCAAIAREKKVPLREVFQAVRSAFGRIAP